MCNHKIQVRDLCRRRMEVWGQAVDLDLADRRITNSSKFNAFCILGKWRYKLLRVA